MYVVFNSQLCVRQRLGHYQKADASVSAIFGESHLWKYYISFLRNYMAEIGRLKKNDTTEIVVQKTEYRGSVGIDLREYVTSEKYTGWSKNGIRVPVEKWKDFKEILDRVESAQG
jgi:hypothetical protein